MGQDDDGGFESPQTVLPSVELDLPSGETAMEPADLSGDDQDVAGLFLGDERQGLADRSARQSPGMT